MRPESLKAAVERHLAECSPLRDRINEFLDEFYTRPADRQRMIDEEPPLTGNLHQDAYVGAIGEHLALRWHLSVPSWVENPCRFLPEPWYVDDVGPKLAAIYRAESPPAFARRLVFTEAEPLRRARFPWRELGLEPV